MSKIPPKKGKLRTGKTFVTEYTNRWGKVMKASAYGYKAWPLGRKK